MCAGWLVGLDATVMVGGAEGRRWVAVSETKTKRRDVREILLNIAIVHRGMSLVFLCRRSQSMNTNGCDRFV